MKWIKYALWCVIAVLIFVPVILIGMSSSHKLSDPEILHHAKRLNEAAAIQIPHFFLMRESLRSQHLELLKKVEAGTPLSAVESEVYRKVFQETLFEGQNFLGLFDGELTLMHDVEMGRDNNVGSRGIKGHHDHHDVSARLNYADVERALADVNSASGLFGFIRRIRAINLAQKSLADVISHMGVAPHTVSVRYQNPKTAWQDNQTGETFETMMRAYKASQFNLVNSKNYWKNVDQAVLAYATLVGQVQEKLWQNSTWWERRIAGRFLDLQTLAPQIDADIPFRR